ncbi:MAG TPA: outer membrane beta-barrel family protein [Chitinophagaceae bacterium]|nr:outer membrane beta-barrel family protein [Chitinophagaceae bacterium]
MRKFLALLIAILTLFFTSQAQKASGKVSGQVVDGNTKTVEAATITLLRAKDSSVAKISAANKDGNFIFENVDDGKYLVSITAVGHTKGFSETFEITPSNSNVTLKTIELVPLAKNLAGVTVAAKKPLIEQKIDRTIVNVEASITNVGTSALEVLEKSPGVSIDKDGNISLKGKQGVQVYIDGRPTYMSGTDLANYLRNLSSNQLDQIEIMTNPPAKYDAAGNAGIINIKTKKTKQLGYSGSFSSTWSQGRYPKVSESFIFNYRKNKLNLFTTLGYNYRKNWQDLDIQRKFIDQSTKVVKSHFDQESRIKEEGQSYNAKVGFDYFATKKTTIGAVVTGYFNPGLFTNQSDVLISDANMFLLSRTLAKTSNDREWKNFSTNVNFRHLLDTTGQEITADLDYVTYRSTNSQDLVNAYYDPNGIPTDKPDTLIGSLPQDINIYTAKVDYTLPLKKGAKFEAGLKTSFVETDNNAVYDSINYGIIVPDYGRSNHFIYKENVNAAYVNYSRPFTKKWFGQFGLRLENTNATGDQVTTGQNFDRHYTQLFPTAFIQYKANDKNSFVLNYGRRIQRPNYQDLNPFILFLDKYTFEQGNPNLQPQFAHNIELTHSYKGFVNTTVNYTRTTDIINQVLEQNTDRNETYVKKDNIAKQRQYGISVSAGGPVKKWWTPNLWMNLYNNKYEGIINNDFVITSATTLQANLQNQFKLGKTLSAELSGYFNSGGIEGVFRIKSFGMVNMGLSQQLFKGKGTLRLTGRDVFRTQKIKGEIKYSNIDAAFQQRRDSRQVALGFTYRFAKGKMNNNQKRKTGGSNEEQSRIKTGDN